MDALLWAVLLIAAGALAVLYRVSPAHARTALNAALGLWITATLAALPLLLVRS